MKKYLLRLVTACMIIFGLIACNKEGSEPLSTLEILQAHKWKYNVMYQQKETETIDLFTEDNCETDDIFEFKADYVVTLYTGEKKCFEDQEVSYTEAYTLNQATDTIQFAGSVPVFIRQIRLDRMEWEAKVFREGEYVTNHFVLIPDK